MDHESKIMKNEIIVWHNGTRWKVREAISYECAKEAIIEASITGSVGYKIISDRRFIGKDKEVIADVVQINSDGTERKPYTEAY